MDEHYRIRSWLCKLCYLYVEEGDRVFLIGHDARCLDTTRKSSGCPRVVCPACKQASPVFPYHPFCVRVFLGAIQTVPKTDNTDIGTLEKQTYKPLCELGQALAFALPVDKPSARELRSHLLEQSFCGNVLGTIADQYNRRCIANRCIEEDRQCIICLFRRLSGLPPELLSKHVLPHVTHKDVCRIVLIYGEVLKAFSLLAQHRACKYSISCADTVRQTRVSFGKGSYISGLSNQWIPGSQTIKLPDNKPKHITVWIDKIGVTDIKFLDSDTIQDVEQPKDKWIYTFPFTENVHIQSKGVFIERIEPPTRNQGRILWNSSQSPIFFKQEPFYQMPAYSNECLVRYVSLQNASAISIGFCSGAMVGILAHVGNKNDHSAYGDTEALTIWTHFPIDETEELLEVGSVTYRDLNKGTVGLVVKTQWKLVWLGHYIPTEIHSLLQVTHIASSPVSAFYYSDPSRPFSQMMQPRTTKHAECVAQFPTYRTSVPRNGMYTDDLFYSDAPLEGVMQVQSCLDRERCIGLLLRYEKYSQTVGEFRYDKEISDCFPQPRSIRVSEEEHDSVRIEFSKEVARLDETEDDRLQPMSGILVWWYGRNMSIVTIIPPEG